MYRIEFTKAFRKGLKKIDKQYHQGIKKQIAELSTDPYNKVEKTKNPNLPTFKTRKGEYRILLEILDDDKKIQIYKVAHRNKIYDIK